MLTWLKMTLGDKNPQQIIKLLTRIMSPFVVGFSRGQKDSGSIGAWFRADVDAVNF